MTTTLTTASAGVFQELFRDALGTRTRAGVESIAARFREVAAEMDPWDEFEFVLPVARKNLLIDVYKNGDHALVFTVRRNHDCPPLFSGTAGATALWLTKFKMFNL